MDANNEAVVQRQRRHLDVLRDDVSTAATSNPDLESLAQEDAERLARQRQAPLLGTFFNPWQRNLQAARLATLLSRANSLALPARPALPAPQAEANTQFTQEEKDRVSRKLTSILRHHVDDLPGPHLGGWVTIRDLLNHRSLNDVSEELLLASARSSYNHRRGQARFQIIGNNIRAIHGNTTRVHRVNQSAARSSHLRSTSQDLCRVLRYEVHRHGLAEREGFYSPDHLVQLPCFSHLTSQQLIDSAEASFNSNGANRFEVSAYGIKAAYRRDHGKGTSSGNGKSKGKGKRAVAMGSAERPA